jgi:predicted nuclease of predicted toxin-antitoxin system
LKQDGHDVACAKDLLPEGADDQQVLKAANEHSRILYTRDRDFIEIARSSVSHAAILFEFITNSPRDLSVAQVASALRMIEKQYTEFDGKIIVVNSFRAPTEPGS